MRTTDSLALVVCNKQEHDQFVRIFDRALAYLGFDPFAMNCDVYLHGETEFNPRIARAEGIRVKAFNVSCEPFMVLKDEEYVERIDARAVIERCTDMKRHVSLFILKLWIKLEGGGIDRHVVLFREEDGAYMSQDIPLVKQELNPPEIIAFA